MALYHFQPKTSVGYDQFDGFVVRARTKAEAQEIVRRVLSSPLSFQKLEDFTCTLLTPSGEAGVIMESFNAS